MEKKMNKALAGKILNQLREEAISEGVIKNFIQGIEDYFKKYGFIRIEDIDEAHIASETMDLTNTKYTLDIDEEDVHTYHVEFWTPKIYHDYASHKFAFELLAARMAGTPDNEVGSWKNSAYDDTKKARGQIKYNITALAGSAIEIDEDSWSFFGQGFEFDFRDVGATASRATEVESLSEEAWAQEAFDYWMNIIGKSAKTEIVGEAIEDEGGRNEAKIFYVMKIIEGGYRPIRQFFEAQIGSGFFEVKEYLYADWDTYGAPSGLRIWIRQSNEPDPKRAVNAAMRNNANAYKKPRDPYSSQYD